MPASGSATAPVAATGYLAPLAGAIVVTRPFVAPLTRYGPGHRGVDLASTEDEPVRAAGPGVVTFAGVIAGRGVVVIAHPDGVSTEYEPVTAQVGRGAVVIAGQIVAVVHGTHGACALGGCLHWGARRGGEYFDPMLLLRPLGVVRLLPDP
jgi:murein DD-endopeptidase MepM/ murein hydrolase activator NlpD